MKKYIAVFVIMAVFAVSALAQTINNVNLGLNESICLNTPLRAPTICVEVVADTPHVITAHYLKAGRYLAVANQLFFNVSGNSRLTHPIVDPEDYGSMVYWGHRFSHVWCMVNDQSVDVNNVNRVVGVPVNFVPTSGKVWQLNVGESIAFVFNKNGALLGTVKNPVANRKWLKNTFVTIVQATE